MEASEVSMNFEDMSEAEALVYIELKIGLSKTFSGKWDVNKVDEIEKSFQALLHQYKRELSLKVPIPRVRSWVTENKVNFILFDRTTGNRILLGDWMRERNTVHEQ